VNQVQNAVNVQDAVNEYEFSDSEGKSEAEEKFLTFWTDQELFGVPISDVVQIISMQKITPLPDFPDYAKGVINLRGNIIPVIDMRVRLKKPETDYDESTCIIVTSINDAYIGFIVDTVDEVADISKDDISPAPKVSRDTTNKYLTGIGQVGDKVVLLLDISKILSEKEFQQVSETVDEAEESVPPTSAETNAPSAKEEAKADSENN
jgi:purine-binding chemotaxis protein CheW